MLNAYTELFDKPGSKSFVLAGLIARIPLPMTGIGIITMLSQVYGSYAIAGAVAATFVLTYALLSPQISRLVDRHGQRRVLPAATVICLFGLLLLLSSTWLQAPQWTLFIGAALAGVMPSMSAMVRARWTAAYRGQPQLQTAFSLETVLDEVTFVVGPPMAVGMGVGLFPQAGLLAAAVLLAVGVLALVMQHASEPSVGIAGEGVSTAASVLRIAEVRLLTLLMAAMGVIVGTIDIASVAFAEQAGRPAAASFVLSAYAVGSCFAGLLFGARQLGVPLHRLLLLGGLATATTTLPLMLVDSIPALAAAVFVSGLFFAPTMIIAMSLIERVVPERQLTEGMTWLLAGLNVGVAFGAVASGQVVDSFGAQAGFSIALIGGAVVLLTSIWGHQSLARNE